MDLILDQTGSSPSEGDIRGNKLTHIINPTRKQPKIFASCVVYKGKLDYYSIYDELYDFTTIKINPCYLVIWYFNMSYLQFVTL